MKSKLKDPKNIPDNDNWMFRYEANTYYADVELICNIYMIFSRTPKGVWIIPSWIDLERDEDIKLHRKFVKIQGRKKYAYETRELALHSFMCRKKRQIEILESQLKKAKDAFTCAGGVLPIPKRCVTHTLDW